MTASRQVASVTVYDFLAPLLGSPGLGPGTPAWVALDDRDPDKWRAVLWSSVWWAVAEDARQAGAAEASRAISTAADWPAISRAVLQRRTSGVYIPRQVA